MDTQPESTREGHSISGTRVKSRPGKYSKIKMLKSCNRRIWQDLKIFSFFSLSWLGKHSRDEANCLSGERWKRSGVTCEERSRKAQGKDKNHHDSLWMGMTRSGAAVSAKDGIWGLSTARGQKRWTVKGTTQTKSCRGQGGEHPGPAWFEAANTHSPSRRRDIHPGRHRWRNLGNDLKPARRS